MKKIILLAFLIALTAPAFAVDYQESYEVEEPAVLGICPQGGKLERYGTCDKKGKKGHKNCYLVGAGCCHKSSGSGGGVEQEVKPVDLQDALTTIEDDLEHLREMIDQFNAQ